MRRVPDGAEQIFDEESANATRPIVSPASSTTVPRCELVRRSRVIASSSMVVALYRQGPDLIGADDGAGPACVVDDDPNTS